MNRWLAMLQNPETGGGGTDRTDKSPSDSFVSEPLGASAKSQTPSVSFVSAYPPRVSKNADANHDRLRRLAKLIDCPAFYVERLHPNEIAEYAHYPDAEVLASLRHLAACRECRARQCRPVTCATCASFLPNQLNPEAGMGQCADGFAKTGPLPWPHVQRHCHAWRKAAAEPAPCGEGG